MGAPNGSRFERAHNLSGRYVAAKGLLVGPFCALVLTGVVGACGPQPPAIERDDCHLKMVSCQNRCNKSGFSVACDLCCFEVARKCDRGADYSFYSCED
jgi:hypothetical protein